MDENRKKLIGLMDDLSFPLSPEEAEDKVKALSDEEVVSLISVYSDIVDYEDSLEEYVRNHKPEEYNKLLDKRDEEIKTKLKEKQYELELAEEEEDLKLDAEEIKLEREIEEIVGNAEKVQQFAEGVADDIDKAAESLENETATESTSNTQSV